MPASETTKPRRVPPPALPRERWLTWANAVTIVRAVSGVIILALALHRHSEALNYAGLAVYWLLDIADGALARVLDQETRIGAQLDIHADRLLVTFFFFNLMNFDLDLVVPSCLFLFNFVLLDGYLSNQFMRWPILSPNYFHQVDHTIWKYNWSAPAKALNSGLVVLILIATPWVTLATVICAIISVEKISSIMRLHRLPHPERSFVMPAVEAVERGIP